jgi:hypothetical protein
MKKLIGILLMAALLSSCAIKPIKTGMTNNGVDLKNPVTVDILFDFDGVRMYRFIDNGHYIYFAKTTNGVRVSWQQSEGKTTRPVAVSTVSE